MSVGEVIFVAALVGIPLWLVIRAWSRYSSMKGSEIGDRLQMQAGLTLASLSTCMWIGVLALMILEDSNAEVRSIARNISPGAIGLINLLVCSAALVCSQAGRRSAPHSARLRFAIALSSGCLMLGWVILAANPH